MTRFLWTVCWMSDVCVWERDRAIEIDNSSGCPWKYRSGIVRSDTRNQQKAIWLKQLDSSSFFGLFSFNRWFTGTWLRVSLAEEHIMSLGILLMTVIRIVSLEHSTLSRILNAHLQPSAVCEMASPPVIVWIWNVLQRLVCWRFGP